MPFLVSIQEPPSDSDIIVNVMPDWLQNLQDQNVTVGDHLIYEFGDPVDQFGSKVEVSLDL